MSVKHFQQLAKIKGWRQQVFVLALAERSLPNLIFGLEVLGIEPAFNISRLSSALWTSLVAQNKASLEASANALALLVKQLSERSEYGARPAESTAQLLGMVLDLKHDPKLSLAREAAQLSLQTVTHYIEFSEGEGLSDNELVMLFDKHPLAREELAFQRELQRLLRAPVLQDVVGELRELAYNEGVSNIGISLEA